MKRILSAVAVAAVMASAGAAVAADLIVDSVVAEPAAKQGGFYAKFFAGGSWANSDVTAVGLLEDVPIGFTFDLGFEGYILGAAIGTEILPNLRGEVEFSVVNTELTEFLGFPVEGDGSLNSTGYNLLANLWYDIDTGTAFTPYIGGGLGYGYNVVTFSEGPGEINTSGLLYQLGAGISYAATEDISLDLGYRYRVRPDAEVTFDGLELEPGQSITSNTTNHIVQAGVTFNF